MGRGPSYPLEKIEEGLTALVFSAGNQTEASRRTGVPRKTLDGWRVRYTDRYEELRDKYGSEIEERVMRDARDLAAGISQTERLAVQRVNERLEKDDDNQPATTLQRLSTSKAINIDKALLLEGRPNVIVEQRSTRELLGDISSKLGEAVEVEVVEGPDDS